jgi:hypothetical protein
MNRKKAVLALLKQPVGRRQYQKDREICVISLISLEYSGDVCVLDCGTYRDRKRQKIRQSRVEYTVKYNGISRYCDSTKIGEIEKPTQIRKSDN